jgi:hypothetical protein
MKTYNSTKWPIEVALINLQYGNLYYTKSPVRQ